MVLPLTVKQLRTAFRAAKAFNDPEGIAPELEQEIAQLLSDVLVDENGKTVLSPEQAADLTLDVQMDIVVKSAEVVTKKKNQN